MPIARVVTTPPLAAAPAAAAPAAAPPAAVEVASDAPVVIADDFWVYAGFVLVALGWLLGWVLWTLRDPTEFKGTADATIFAPMYVLAQAIERLLEPFSSFLGKTKSNDATKVDKKTALTDLYAATVSQNAATIAKAKQVLDQVRRNTAVITWALASFIAMAACGAFGILLMRAIGFDVPAQVDIAMSGLAIGSGTKPLHDLIANLQKNKEKKEDPKETGGTV